MSLNPGQELQRLTSQRRPRVPLNRKARLLTIRERPHLCASKARSGLNYKPDPALEARILGYTPRSIDCVKVVCALQPDTRRKAVQQTGSNVAAKLRRSRAELVRADPTVDEWPERAASQVRLPIDRELVEVQVAGNRPGKVVIAKDPFRRKVAGGDVGPIQVVHRFEWRLARRCEPEIIRPARSHASALGISLEASGPRLDTGCHNNR